MRKLILGLTLLAGAQAAWSQCALDSTVVIKAGAPGVATSGTPVNSVVYDPDAAGAINSIFKNCTEATITVRLNIEAALSALVKDTVKLANSIKINDRSGAGKSTALTMTRASSPAAGLLDTLFTLVENTANPNLLTVGAGNQVTITNMGFARKIVGNNTHSVIIGSKGSIVTACHFWMADNSSQGTGSLLDVTADSVLIERSLFRAPPDGVGRTTGVHTGGSATRVEIRANVFFSTGLQMAGTGTFHVIANTFTGSRNEFNAIIIGNGISDVKNAVIMHNLFVPKVDTLPPISFAASTVNADSILRNAWSRGKPNLPLAVVGSSNLAVTLTNATSGNVNTPLPRGFSNYGPASGDVKDYAITQLKKEPTLARKHADFGKIYRVFLNSDWAGNPGISDVSSMQTGNRMYFPGFSPFLAGKSWLTKVKVGAFVDQDQIEIPSPLDSGAQGASLKFQRDTTNTARIKMTQTRYDGNYYKANITPDSMYFFFSNTLSKLTVSNDSSVLKNAPHSLPFVRKQFLGDDSLITVPPVVRTGGDIYIKMLHYRQGQQAPVQSNAVIALVTGFPSFPVNDLKLSQDGPSSNAQNGVVVLNVTRGPEAIDSVRILTLNEGGQTVQTDVKAATTGIMVFTINIADKGNYFFQAVPVAKIGNTPKAGQPTASVGPIPVRFNASDEVYVTFKSGTCTGADGSQTLPFCALDTALKEIASKKGGTIIIRNGSPVVNLEDIVIPSFGATDTSNVTITSGRFDEGRPIIRGKTTSAITISRRNVTLRGFTIEMPVGSTGAALNIKAAGCVVDANIFRAAAKGAAEGPAVNFEVGATAEARFVNNVVWGFTKNVVITNSASANIKIMNNTFVDDASLSNAGKTSGISVTGTAASAVIANNFFSGIQNPIDTTVSGKTVVLDHNVYSLKSPNLRGIADAGGLDSSSAVAPTDIWVGTYTQTLETAFTNVIDCNSISPCNSLYAGSSANGYNVNLATDVLGRQRTNRKEVGAYEFASSPASVLGVVQVVPTLIPGTYKRMDIVIVGKNFDPDSKETDSLQVFWTTQDVSKNATAALAALPANQRKTYPISRLATGSIKDVADSITKENTKYYFYAALSRNSGTRKLGYPYSDTITSSVNLKFDQCNFADSKSACPSETGIFGVDTGTWKGKFESRVLLTEAIAAGTVEPPSFNSVKDANVFNLDLTSPLPTITFNTKVTGLGTAGSKQKATWQVDMYTSPDLAGLELFLLPNTSTGMAQLVPFWDLDSIPGGKTRLIIESSIDGPQTYAFGKVQMSMAPGQVLPSPAVPVFDFASSKDSAILHIPIKVKGTAFKTGNPLILVSIIPAGGTVAPASGAAIPKVLSKGYHSHTLALSSGYAGLLDSLRKARFHQHYLKAVAAEAASTAPNGQNKPFVLETVTSAEFNEVVETQDLDLAVTAGETDSFTINVPVNKAFKDYAGYTDQKGKASRSIEVVFTAFDGSKISRSSAYIRTKFVEKDLQVSEKGERGSKGYKQSRNEKPQWNLFGYPWAESDTGSYSRIMDRPKWAPENMRLLRYKGSGTGASAFTAYNGTNNADIKFSSGQAAWSGFTSSYTPTSASGMSLDYQPFDLSLTNGIWNDICLPFNFKIKWQDVLDASGLTTATAPALFRYDDSLFKWEPVTAASASPPVAGSVLRPWDGYTTKPTGTASVTLKFPLLDESRSATATPKTSANDGSWAVMVEAANNTAAMELRIGRGASENWFPEAPDVPGQDFRLALARPTPAGEEKVSQHYQALGSDWRGHWALRAGAAKGSRGVALRLTGATKDVPVWLVDVVHGTAVPLSKEAPIQVSGDALAANDYHLVAGDQAYVDGILKGMMPLHLLALGNYPNPFSGSTLIRYALPAGFGKVRYDMKVRDFRGRTVWEKTVQGGHSLSYMWDGRDRANSVLPAGVYTLSLSAHAEGKPAYRAVRGILKM